MPPCLQFYDVISCMDQIVEHLMLLGCSGLQFRSLSPRAGPLSRVSGKHLVATRDSRVVELGGSTNNEACKVKCFCLIYF